MQVVIEDYVPQERREARGDPGGQGLCVLLALICAMRAALGLIF